MINSNPQYNDLIDAYFDNSMSSDERESFMNELENNTELKREFDFHLELQEAIADPHYDEINAAIEEVINPNVEGLKPNKGNTRFFQLLKYAAAIVVISAFTILLTRYNASSGNASLTLVHDYFEPYPAYNTFRGETNTEAMIESAFQNYESGEFEVALGIFANLIKSDPDNMAYVFYNANAQFALGEYAAANELFSTVVESGNELFGDQAKWYLALSHLGMDNVQSGEAVLTEIKVDPNSKFNQKASELLGRLK